MPRELKGRTVGLPLTMLSLVVAGLGPSAFGDVLCVNAGKASCFETIAEAVSSAAPGDTIEVAQGTYREDVIIGKSLSLVGKNSANTTIDATGKSNGIYIDGRDHSGLSNVV